MYAHDHNNFRLRHFLHTKAHEDEPPQADDLLAAAIYPNNLNSLKPSGLVPVFDVKKMRAIVNEHSRSSNLHRNHKRYLNFLEGTAGNLPLAKLPMTIFEDLDALAERFPNFGYAVDYFKEQFALAFLTEHRPFAADPLLILGPPGVGKTAFCHELSRLVNTHFKVIAMAGMTAGFVIGGMSSGWADGKPGKVVQALARGKRANPLYVVDEIDKVGGDKRYDPLGALYSLLEKETAASFIDESLEIPTNCANAVWVATANYPEKIAEPVLSRFTVIEVAAPSGDQRAKVLKSIYAKVRGKHSWGSRFNSELTPAVVDKMVSSKMEPRLLQKALVSACGKAVLREIQNNKSAPDVVEIRADDVVIPATQQGAKPNKSSGTTRKAPDVVVMPILNVESVPALEREVTLVQWSIREVAWGDTDRRSKHLVGFVKEDEKWHVSARVEKFDRQANRVRTSDGRMYHLEGQPGTSDEAENVWIDWKDQHDIHEDLDVTHQYCAIH
jgi:ATP-dependent Lon protease